MNEFDPTLDEIVSAYVDGAATPDERARVESDPALVARAARFRELDAAIAAPPEPVDDDVRAAFITRALNHSASVHDLRPRRFDMVAPIAAAAVIIAALFGLGTWLVAAQDGSSDSASTAAAITRNAADGFTAAESADAAKSLAGSSATSPAATTAAGAPTGPPTTIVRAPVELGRFDDQDSLRRALVASRQLSATTPTTATQATSPDSFTVAACPHGDLVDPVVYTAQLQGRPVTIFVTGTRGDVFDNATCARTTIDLTNR